MTTIADSLLFPIEDAIAGIARRRGHAAVHGLHPGLVVHDPTGWVSAARLMDGTLVPTLIDTAKQRWGAQPHAAAALAWKSYSYWVALPVVTGYAVARRVPLPRPADVLLQFHDHAPFLSVGLRRTPMAVLPGDPLARAGSLLVEVVPDERALRTRLRETLLDAHLGPVLERIRATVNVGRRTLLGSVASGVAYGVLRGADSPASAVPTVLDLLTDLGVADLVDLQPIAGGTDVQVWRRTCCLAFTLPEPKVCSGCCIR